MDIKTLLDSYNSNNLWEMAREAQLPQTTGKKLKKDDLITLMAREFFQPKRIRASYQRLTEKEKAILNRLLLHGEQVSTRLFKRELIRVGLATEARPKQQPKEVSAYGRYQGWSVYGRTVTYIGQPHDQNSSIFEDIIARLTLFGLVFSEETTPNTVGQPFKLQFHPANTLTVPNFVRQHLPEPQPLPPEAGGWQPAHTLYGDPQLILRDLYLYWDTVRRNPIPMIKSGLVSKRGMKQLNENLLTPDPNLNNARSEEQSEWLFTLRQMLQALKLVQAKHGELVAAGKGGLAIPQFWQDATTEQIRAVIAVWKGLRTPVYLADRHSYYVTPNPQTAVQYLITVLSETPVNTWIDADLLLISLQEHDRDFLIASRSRLEDQRSYYYGDKSKLISDMDAYERAFVAQAIGGFLFQMGLVELGFENPTADPTQWSTFRLTPLGTAVFKDIPLDSPPITGQIVIQPNFQILALGPVSLNLLARLDLFAERQKTDRSAFEYRLSRESVYAAQQMGFTVTEVERFLTAVTPNGLPQNIQRSLAEWAAHHERIVFRSGVTLLQAADETLLAQLLENEQTGEWLARPVGSGVALVKTNHQHDLIAALQAEGLLPAISGANPEAADNGVTVHEDGRIQPIHAVPSLHLRGRLARFTVEAGDDEWLLTETAVRRAGGSKKKAHAIVEELRKLHRGRLPQTIVERVKAWGGYYGSATVGTLTLFEFRDQETLAELCQHPELQNLLQPFPAGTRALAVVEGEMVTAVQTILARLGVIITPITS